MESYIISCFFILYYWKQWDIAIAVKDIIEIVLTLNKVPFLGATWFLPALFWVSIFVHILITLLERNRMIGGVLLIVGILSATLGFQITFPYRVSRTLICALFYILGYLFQRYIRKHISYGVSSLVAIVFILLYYFCIQINVFSMGNNVYKYKIIFVIGALLAIYFTIWFSETLCKVGKNDNAIRHLVFLGQNSIDIVIWQFLAFRITIIIQIVFLQAAIISITSFPVYDSSGAWWFVYLISGIYGSLLWKAMLKNNPLSKYVVKMYYIKANMKGQTIDE